MPSKGIRDAAKVGPQWDVLQPILRPSETVVHDPMYGPTVRRKRDFRDGLTVLRQCIRPRCGASQAPGHDGYQRAFVLISGKASRGRLGHQVSNAPADVGPSLNPSRRPRWDPPSLDLVQARGLKPCALRSRGPWFRSRAPWQARSRRCAPACWRAPPPGHCGAFVGTPPQARGRSDGATSSWDAAG